MKNIHVIPTDKPSRLLKSVMGYNLHQIPFSDVNKIGCNRHIYITNDEEIKKGDWILNPTNEVQNCIGLEKGIGTDNICWVKVKETTTLQQILNSQKIILTTDQDLIKDGVQAIDDDFLEWFVQNPSCEEVDINRDWGYPKIIIPKEEQTFGESISNTIGIINVARQMFQPNEPKQETTLEEVAERILANNIDGLRDALKDDDLFFFYKGVIQCYGEAMAKWQQERMYSEEDMKQFAFECVANFLSNDDNKVEIKLVDVVIDRVNTKFEQFKKK